MSKRQAYTLDFSRWQSRDEALDELLEVLPVPEHCGRNLDALADALSEAPAFSLELRHALALGDDPLGRWLSRLRTMLVDATLSRHAPLTLTR